MAQLKSASKSKQPQPKQQEKQQPPLKQFINFTKTTPGFERSLRLIQALSQIVADVSAHDAVKAARWATAKSQLALSKVIVYLHGHDQSLMNDNSTTIFPLSQLYKLI